MYLKRNKMWCMIIANVIWNEIEGYEGYYEVSQNGTVRSITRVITSSTYCRTLKSKIIKSRINNRGYEDVRLSKDGITTTKCVHRLVAIAFISPLQNRLFVNHKNGIKTCNDSYNLEWVNHAENMQHAYDTGLIKKATPVIDIFTGEKFESTKLAAKLYNINPITLRGYLNGQLVNKTGLRYIKAA